MWKLLQRERALKMNLRNNQSRKFLLSASALVCLNFYNPAMGAQPPTLNEEMQNSYDLSFSKVKHIRRVLESKQDVLRSVTGLDITVVVGGTGSGKSTLINLLAGVQLEVDLDGCIQSVSSHQGMKIGGGFHSITKYPESIDVPGLGLVYDLPGFEDTEGALDDLLNAAFIRGIVTGARSVKVIYVTSKSDMDAARGPSFKRLIRSMKMFEGDELQPNGVMLLVNKVDRELINNGRIDQVFAETVSGLDISSQEVIKGMLQRNQVVFIPKTRSEDRIDAVLSATRTRVLEQMIGLNGYPIQNVNMALTFNAETLQCLMMFYHHLMEEVLKSDQKTIFALDQGNPSAITAQKPYHQDPQSSVESHIDRAWDKFQVAVMREQAFKILHPLSELHYRGALKGYRSSFEKEYSVYEQVLQVQELLQQTQKAEFEKRKAENQQKESLKQAELAEKKAAELFKQQSAAEEIARKHQESAKKANAESLRYREEIKKAEAEAQKAIDAAKIARESAHQNEVDKQAAIELAKVKESELRQLRQAVQSYEDRRKDALQRASEAEQDVVRIQKEKNQHQTYIKQLETNQKQIEIAMKAAQLSQEAAEQMRRHAEQQLQSAQNDLKQRDSQLTELQKQIKTLRQEQGDVSALRIEINELRSQLQDKDREIARLGGGSGYNSSYPRDLPADDRTANSRLRPSNDIGLPYSLLPYENGMTKISGLTVDRDKNSNVFKKYNSAQLTEVINNVTNRSLNGVTFKTDMEQVLKRNQSISDIEYIELMKRLDPVRYSNGPPMRCVRI
jgi:energy-coupling factor transporter ATP-binding protein EcfA2